MRVAVSDGEEYGFRGCFYEVRPAELIVQTFTFEGVPDGVAHRQLSHPGERRGRVVSSRRPTATENLLTLFRRLSN